MATTSHWPREFLQEGYNTERVGGEPSFENVQAFQSSEGRQNINYRPAGDDGCQSNVLHKTSQIDPYGIHYPCSTVKCEVDGMSTKHHDLRFRILGAAGPMFAPLFSSINRYYTGKILT